MEGNPHGGLEARKTDLLQQFTRAHTNGVDNTKPLDPEIISQVLGGNKGHSRQPW